MRPSAIRCCSSILATASALPSTRATTLRSSTSSLPAPSSFRAKAPRSKKSKSALTLRRTRFASGSQPALCASSLLGDSPSSHDCSFRLHHRILPRTPTSPLLSCHHGKPFLQRRRWHSRRPGPFPDRHHHELPGGLLPGQSSQRCRFLLELFRREHFRHHPDPYAFRRGSALLERSQHSRLGSHSCRFALHLRGRARQHAHLFSPH